MVSMQVVVGWFVAFIVLRYFFGKFFPALVGAPGGDARAADAGGRAGVFPPHIAVRINELTQAFPQVSRASIEADLRRTRNVDVTVENLIHGRVQAVAEPAPVVPAAQAARVSVASTPSTPSTPAKPTTYAAVMQKIDTPVREPSKGWVADPDERQSVLAQRKAFMLQQARSRYLAKMARASAAKDAQTPSVSQTGGSSEAAVLASAESHTSGAGLHRRGHGSIGGA